MIDKWLEFQDDQDFINEFQKVFSAEDIPEADNEFEPDSYDNYINMEIIPSLQEELNALRRAAGGAPLDIDLSSFEPIEISAGSDGLSGDALEKLQ